MELYYVARGLGATSRGVGILKVLGTGTMITAWRHVCELEKLPYFGGLPRHGGIFVWDAVAQRPDILGTHFSVGDLGLDVDQVLDVQIPLLARPLTSEDLKRGEDWWLHPPPKKILINGVGVLDHSKPEAHRVLACRGGTMPKWRRFRMETVRSRPEARFALPDRDFYWPALALMATADEVIGGGQSQREYKALKDKNLTGAEFIAGEIRSYLERTGVTLG